jgi:site-specific DNA-cytosine methylase
MDHIEAHRGYEAFSKWLEERQFHRVAERVLRFDEKIKSGGNIMRKHIEVPKVRINAFIGHVPGSLTHPYEDRFLTVRECLSVMRMPDDFELLNPKRSINHVCQNVPVTTAADVVTEALSALSGAREWRYADEEVNVFDNRKDSRTVPSVADVFV